MRLKTQVSFPLSFSLFFCFFFAASLFLTLWLPTERQLAQTGGLPHGDEEREEEMEE